MAPDGIAYILKDETQYKFTLVQGGMLSARYTSPDMLRNTEAERQSHIRS